MLYVPYKSFPRKKKSGKQFFFLGSLYRHLREKEVYSFLVNRDICKNPKFKKKSQNILLEISVILAEISWFPYIFFQLYMLYRKVCPNLGHPVPTSLFTKYNFLQAKNRWNNCEWTVSFEIVSAFEWLFMFFVTCLQHLYKGRKPRMTMLWQGVRS